MRKIGDMIEEIIIKLKENNDSGYYIHTIKALEKIKSQLTGDKDESLPKNKGEKDDSSE